MSRSKKRKKPRVQQKKQTESAGRKIFYKQMKTWLTKYGCEEVYDLLTETNKRALFTLRSRPAKVYRGNKEHLTSEKFREVESLILDECENIFVPVQKGGAEISLKEFYTIGINMFLLQEWATINPLPELSRIREILLEKLDLTSAEKLGGEHVQLLVGMVTLLFSEPNKFFLGIDVDICKKKANGGRGGLEFHLYTQKPKIRMFTLDKQPRPLFQLGLFGKNRQMFWTRTNRSFFDSTPFDDGQTIPVFIQSHAIHRIHERLDVFGYNYAEWPLSSIFYNPKVIRHKGHHLIEYIFDKKKLGYLVATLEKNALLIKTFLFLTNSGTPEGEKLSELSGLSKIDVKYWNIDKLSTFCCSDIKENEDLKQLFTEAGCGDLFEVKPLSDLSKGRIICQAEEMMKYMMVE